ncbi:unnamed protein product [Kluyveromyces dobzhanskii CBS 2104]|uniref:WGS project CCBQ000000000 data, contig 00106 n=1 Tax=Kluyveromyces dobzhanskii CBS 2104 TaxID=1427455 RepID=A0A0A8L5U6_9SACH|nr:unnamed protein product [Kluyveromyces dobzhanskii CBS 2104]
MPILKNRKYPVGCLHTSTDILTYIENLPTPEERVEAHDKIEAVERKAMDEMVPQSGISELFKFLHENNVSKSICTRNLIKPVSYLIDSFVPAELQEFKVIVTREFQPPKPKPDPLLHIAKQLNTKPSEMVMVGDSIDDMRSGADAGFITILLENDVNRHLTEDKELVHYSVNQLDDIVNLFESV